MATPGRGVVCRRASVVVRARPVPCVSPRALRARGHVGVARARTLAAVEKMPQGKFCSGKSESGDTATNDCVDAISAVRTRRGRGPSDERGRANEEKGAREGRGEDAGGGRWAVGGGRWATEKEQRAKTAESRTGKQEETLPCVGIMVRGHV